MLCDSDNFVGCILTNVGWLSEMETDTLRALLKDIYPCADNIAVALKTSEKQI